MREKNIRRAAEALYWAQADDKNELLASRITDKEIAKLVKDQGRALVVLEKLILPRGKNAFETDEMFDLLLSKLKKKGHRIQDDDTPDDEQYAAEKKQYMDDRLAKVPELLGMKLSDLPPKEEKPTEFTLAGEPVQISKTAPDFFIDDAPAVREKPNYDKIFAGVAVGLIALALLLRSSEG